MSPIILIVILLICIFFAMTQNEYYTPTSQMAKLCLYCTAWCKYSQMILPEWKKLSDFVKQNNMPIELTMIDCEKDSNICSAEGITGYPTVVLVKKDGKKINYTGERKSEAMIKFIKSSL